MTEGTATTRSTSASPTVYGEATVDLDRPEPPLFERYPEKNWWWGTRRIPWTLYRYVLAEIARASFLAILAVSVVYSAVVAFQTVSSGIQLAFIWPFLAKTFAYPLFCSLPLAILFGVTLTFGRMVSDLEVAAARSHGASHLQLYGPLLALGVLCTGVGYYLNGWVVPELHYEKKNLQQYIIRQLDHLGSGTNRTILLPEGGGSLFVGSYEGRHLRRVHIDLKRELQKTFIPNVREQLPEKLPESITLLAQDGEIQITPDRRGVNLHLRGVDILIPEKISGTRTGRDNFIQKFSISDKVQIPLSFQKRRRGVKDRNNANLSEFIAEQETLLELDPNDRRAQRQLRNARGEWHRRFAFSLSGITFPLIGVTLCFLLNLRARLVPFFASNLVVLTVFYPLLMVGAYLAQDGSFAPGLAMALPNLALLLVGFFLVRRVAEK